MQRLFERDALRLGLLELLLLAHEGHKLGLHFGERGDDRALDRPLEQRDRAPAG